MTKRAFFCIVSLFVCCVVAAQPQKIRLDDHSTTDRVICGFEFAAVHGLVVVAKPISEDSIKSRVDNERYNACPYNVEVTYQGISMRLDFGSDINLDRIRNVADEGPVRTAFLRYDENGWQAAGDDVLINKPDLAIHEDKNGLALSGIVQRKGGKTRKNDFCFALDVIGEEKYATGAVCRATKAELTRMSSLFSKSLVIRSNS